MSYLAPDIITAIVEGRQPAHFQVRDLRRIADLPIDWNEQRKLLRFA